MGIIKVHIAVLLVTSVAPATMKHNTRFISQGSKSLNTVSWSPINFDNPETLKKNNGSMKIYEAQTELQGNRQILRLD